MKSGFLSLKITPPAGVPLAGNAREDSRARGTHDELYANYAYLETAAKRHLFISLDLIGIKKSDADLIKKRISQLCGLAAEDITIAATHTHSGPNTVEIFKTYLTPADMRVCADYCVWLVEAVSGAALAAVDAAADSLVGLGHSKVEGYSFNRRIMTDDGALRMIFEPYDRGRIDRLAGPNGDTEMHVFVFTDRNERIRGLIVQYTSHPAVVCGEDWLYTRDYIHALTEELKNRYSRDVVVLYMNGAQGNQVAADPYRPFVTGFAEAERVGKGLALGAARIIDEVLTGGALFKSLPFASVTDSVTLPIRTISREEISRAKKMLSLSEGSVQLHGLDPRVEAESILEMAEIREKEYTTVIQAIRLGNALILTFPGEVFLEHAHSALEGAPFEDAMIFGLANDYVGYIPTREAFEEGGYEIKTSYVSSRFAPCAGEALVEACQRLIGKLVGHAEAV